MFISLARNLAIALARATLGDPFTAFLFFFFLFFIAAAVIMLMAPTFLLPAASLRCLCLPSTSASTAAAASSSSLSLLLLLLSISRCLWPAASWTRSLRRTAWRRESIGYCIVLFSFRVLVDRLDTQAHAPVYLFNLFNLSVCLSVCLSFYLSIYSI